MSCQAEKYPRAGFNAVTQIMAKRGKRQHRLSVFML